MTVSAALPTATGTLAALSVLGRAASTQLDSALGAGRWGPGSGIEVVTLTGNA